MSTLQKLRSKKPERPPLTPGMRRVLALSQGEDKVPDQTSKYALPGCRYSLRPIQSRALYHLEKYGGLCAPIGVGHGKFLISALAPTVVSAERPVLLVPPALEAQTRKEIKKFREHFRISNNIRVLSYSKLSVASGAKILDDVQPDLIIADECHHLRHRTATRTKRVIRYFQSNPTCKFVALSGTLTAKGLADYAHIVEIALRNNAPIPLDFWELQIWAACLDVGGSPDTYERQCFQPMVEQYGGNYREAYFRRFRSTPGVVATQDSSASCAIYMRTAQCSMPTLVRQAIDHLERTWTAPGGEEIEDALEMARVRRQVLCGFYYVWDWPDGNPDWDWLDARGEWHRQVRRVLKRSQEGRDSPLLVARWAQSDACHDRALVRAWNEWDAQRGKKQPPVRTVWIDKYLVDAAMRFIAKQAVPTIIWCQHRALLEEFEERGLPTYGAGMEIPDVPAHNCAMSISAHGTGKNLQRWSENLLTSFLPNGSALEQLIGRTHRLGQQADEVNVWYFDQHDSVWLDIKKAREVAQYITETQGNRMKILSAMWT
jgi:hypothetical protein